MLRKRLGKQMKFLSVLKAIDQNDIDKVRQNVVKMNNLNQHIPIAYGADTTLLCRAARNGYVDIVRLLANQGADVNVSDGENVFPLEIATELNHVAVTKELLSRGANKKFSKAMCIHLAAANGHIEIIKILQQYTENIDIQDEKGDTALHRCVQYGHHVVAKALLDQGINANIQNYDGNTALHLSCFRRQVSTVNSIKCAKVLLDYGAQIDLRNNDGNTPEEAAYDKSLYNLITGQRRGSNRSISISKSLSSPTKKTQNSAVELNQIPVEQSGGERKDTPKVKLIKLEGEIETCRNKIAYLKSDIATQEEQIQKQKKRLKRKEKALREKIKQRDVLKEKIFQSENDTGLVLSMARCFQRPVRYMLSCFN